MGIKNRKTNGNFCACFVPIYRNVYDHSLITNLMSITERPCKDNGTERPGPDNEGTGR